jgi:hypothetical protein
MEDRVTPAGSRKANVGTRQASRSMSQANTGSRNESSAAEANVGESEAASDQEDPKRIAVIEETLDTPGEEGQQLGRDATALLKRFSSRFVAYTEKDPPKAALACLAIGTVLGIIVTAALKD